MTISFLINWREPASSNRHFDRISVESLNLFSNYDTYKGEFIDLLINDTCKLTQSVLSGLPKQQMQIFFSNSPAKWSHHGNELFTRKVRETIMMLNNRFVMRVKWQCESWPSINEGSLHLAIFEIIDESIIFITNSNCTRQPSKNLLIL